MPLTLPLMYIYMFTFLTHHILYFGFFPFIKKNSSFNELVPHSGVVILYFALLCVNCFFPAEFIRCKGRFASITIRPVYYGIQTWNILFTPRYIGVSSKNVLSVFDDGNRMIFPITPAVEGHAIPSVSGGAVAQHPLRTTSHSRRQELIKVTLIKCVVS